MIELFITNNNINGTTLESSPLHLAILNQRPIEIVRLLSTPTSQIACAWNGNTPLHRAILNEYWDAIPLVTCVAACIKKNSYGDTPLHLMCKKPNGRVSAALIHGENRDYTNNKGRTPLHDAVENKYSLEIIQSLCTMINRDIADNSAETPLHIAVIKKSSVEMIRHLVSKTNLDKTDLHRRTPLQLGLLQKCAYRIIKLLVTPANVHIRDYASQSPLEAALEHKYKLNVVQLLITPANADAAVLYAQRRMVKWDIQHALLVAAHLGEFRRLPTHVAHIPNATTLQCIVQAGSVGFIKDVNLEYVCGICKVAPDLPEDIQCAIFSWLRLVRKS